MRVKYHHKLCLKLSSMALDDLDVDKPSDPPSEWEGEIARLDHRIDHVEVEISEINEALSTLGGDVRSAMRSAQRAQAAAQETAAQMRALRTDISGQIDQQTAAIIVALHKDSDHDRKIAVVERQISVLTEAAMTRITVQTDKAGKGLARKVTIPVGTIAAVATIIQWLIHWWPHTH